LVKFFSEGHSLGNTGSNNTGLKFVLCRGLSKRAVTRTQTHRFWVLCILIKIETLKPCLKTSHNTISWSPDMSSWSIVLIAQNEKKWLLSNIKTKNPIFFP
jgi:hypothetical protein